MDPRGHTPWPLPPWTGGRSADGSSSRAMAPRRSSAARGARWGPGSPVSTRGGGARGRGTGAARDWEEGRARPAPPHARSRVLAGGHLVGLRCGAGLRPPPPWPRVGPAGTELRGRVQAPSRTTGHARRPPPLRLRSRWPCRRRKPRAAAHHGGRRGKGGGGVPRRARRPGAAARMVAGRRGEPGARARRRGWVRGATASAVAGRGGECEGGAQRRRGRRRSTAASWWRGAGRAAPAQGEREGGSRRRKERGWVGEREEGVERGRRDA